jgi:uncharacterized protein (TIGR00251 family)
VGCAAAAGGRRGRIKINGKKTGRRQPLFFLAKFWFCVKLLRMVKISIKVTPNAGKNELVKTADGYRAYVQSPPADGKANAALIKLLSKEFAVPKSNIEILKGLTSREKVVAIEGG